jgi:hypothetical protein
MYAASIAAARRMSLCSGTAVVVSMFCVSGMSVAFGLV